MCVGKISCYDISKSDSMKPYKISYPFDNNIKYIYLDVGDNHMCAITNSTLNNLICFGSNTYGESSIPISLQSMTFTSVSCGSRNTCAISNIGSIFCFGDNSYGQNNIPSITSLLSSDIQLQSLSLITKVYYVKVECAASHTCALTNFGKLYCVGDNRYGQTLVPLLGTIYI